jgi:hypothetical protein
MSYATSESASGRILNDLFNNYMDNPEWHEKMGEAGASYIRNELKETAFSRSIMPPSEVSRSELDRSTQHEGVSRIVDIEPDSRAFVINWRSQAPGRWIYSRRVEFSFFTITTEKYEKSEQELISYEMPITKIIEQNAVKDMQTVEDERFIQSAEAAITLSGKQQVKTGSNPLEKRDVSNANKMLDSDKTKVDTYLMTNTLFNDILGLEFSDIGSKLAGEIIVNGYSYNNLLGHKLVTTIKDDVVPNNEVWLFSPPDFLGKFFILHQPKFWINKEANIIQFQAWEDIALGIKNSKAVAVLRLNDAGPFPII